MTREQCEDTLVGIAVGRGPEDLREAAERLKALLDQDGPAPDDADRARKRFLRLGRQQSDGMTPMTGLLDPEGRATWEPIFAKQAAPGMGNPDDEEPRTSGTPSQEQIDHDTRSYRQRCHDAFVAVGRTADNRWPKTAGRSASAAASSYGDPHPNSTPDKPG